MNLRVPTHIAHCHCQHFPLLFLFPLIFLYFLSFLQILYFLSFFRFCIAFVRILHRLYMNLYRFSVSLASLGFALLLYAFALPLHEFCFASLLYAFCIAFILSPFLVRRSACLTSQPVYGLGSIHPGWAHIDHEIHRLRSIPIQGAAPSRNTTNPRYGPDDITEVVTWQEFNYANILQ
ncbi:uncharacterized protein AFUA_8G06190 [Aspergillus fumigatus Af293]